MKRRVDFVTPIRRGDAPCLSILLDAAVHQKVLLIEYESKEAEESRRRIQPICLYAHNGFWYCCAYCFLRGDERVFRCDRIRRAEPVADTEPLDLGELRFGRRLARRFAAESPRPQEPVRLRASLSRAGVQRCEGELWLEPLLRVKEDGSGSIDGDVPRGELPFYADFLIGLGNEVRLKEPEELRAEIRRKLVHLLERYG
jgi:predicted DNA-binding transcriptional regulator YafY